MNFLPGRLDGTSSTPFGTASSRSGCGPRSTTGGGGGARDVIVGARPELFEDAASSPTGRG